MRKGPQGQKRPADVIGAGIMIEWRGRIGVSLHIDVQVCVDSHDDQSYREQQDEQRVVERPLDEFTDHGTPRAAGLCSDAGSCVGRECRGWLGQCTEHFRTAGQARSATRATTG